LHKQDEFGSNCIVLCRQAHQNIGGNLYIGRYSKGQISADNIDEPIYRLIVGL